MDLIKSEYENKNKEILAECSCIFTIGQLLTNNKYKSLSYNFKQLKEKQLNYFKNKNHEMNVRTQNLKDLIICVLVAGVLGLLGLIIIGDYYVALQENRPVDESVITLMKMSLTGMIGIIAGYIGSR